jgi:peptide subunit release factor 1 (eRF1)
MPLQFSLKSKILMSVVGSGLLFVSIYLIYNQTYNCPQCKAKEIKNINMQNENDLPKTPSLTNFNSKISTVEELKAVLDKKKLKIWFY